MRRIDICTFVLRFFISITLLSFLLIVYLHDINELLITLAETFGRETIHIGVSGSDFVFNYSVHKSGEFPIHLDSMRIHYGPILILAFFLSVPNIAFTQRTKLVVIAIIFGSIAQLFGLVFVEMLLMRAFQKGWGVESFNSTMALFSIFWLLLPGLFCAIWCYIYWLPKASISQR